MLLHAALSLVMVCVQSFFCQQCQIIFLEDLAWSSKQNPLLFSLCSLQQVKSYSSLSIPHTIEEWVLKKDVFYLRMLLQRLNCEHRFGGSQAWGLSNIEVHKAGVVAAFELKFRLNFLSVAPNYNIHVHITVVRVRSSITRSHFLFIFIIPCNLIILQ